MYKYGVSFNCQGDEFEIGGGGEGYTSIDYIGNNLDKIEAAMLVEAKDDDDQPWKAMRDHGYVGECTDVGGKIVSVIGYPWNDEDPDTYNLCVIFEYENEGPTVIE